MTSILKACYLANKLPVQPGNIINAQLNHLATWLNYSVSQKKTPPTFLAVT